MTHRRYSITIQTQLTNISKSLCTIDHHLNMGDHGEARLELECIMSRTTELQRKLSNLENTGRQPEEPWNITITTGLTDPNSR